jgi:hypothetical protein
MNKTSLKQAQLEAIASLQEKLDSLRRRLGVADRGVILYRSEVSYADAEFIVVEANGFGGATMRRAEGDYPTDFMTLEELEFAIEFDAVRAAENLRQKITA